MMTRACNVNGLAGIMVLLAVGGMAAGAAAAWEPPDHWTEIGTVRAWMDTDTKFYRTQEESLFLDESQAKVNQVKEYAKTREYRGQLDGIGMNTWGTLGSEEQDKRRGLARRELKFLVDFRNRVLTQVQNTRMGTASGWGVLLSDRTVVGTALGNLRTAVALDPSNPYAWHLYSYFAMLVGDEYRALQALAGAEVALMAIPEDELQPLRAEVDLDKAWLQRAQGEFAAAQASLESAAAHGVKNLEARLLQGLLAAQLGNDRLAITIATELRSTTVSIFPRNYRTSGFNPEIRNVDAWATRASSYLHDWIMAYTWLREGRLDMAAAAFGSHRLDDQRRFAHRFWNEASVIYEVTGQRNLALKAWNQVRVVTPYYPYLVSKDYQLSLGRLTGRTGRVPYQLGFDSNFLNGNRLAYGAALVAAVAATTDEQEQQELASRALDQLEICQRFGVYTGQASVLQGQIYYLMNDMAPALVEIEEALNHMDAMGDKAGFSAVLAGLNKAEHNLAPQDIANFYGQSGSSRGRWQADADPAATLAALRVAFDGEASDKNRRDLARFLIRNGEVDEGRALAQSVLDGAALSQENIVELGAGDVELILEADRVEGQTELAVKMVQALQGGIDDPWRSASVWTLAGFICLDHDLRPEGRAALERASELDPGNHGLKIQLSLM